MAPATINGPERASHLHKGSNRSVVRRALPAIILRASGLHLRVDAATPVPEEA